MIIDLIIDRKCGEPYSPERFYREVMEYGEFVPEYADPITRAMDEGTESDVKQALCKYITNADYNPIICKYINSVNWL